MPPAATQDAPASLEGAALTEFQPGLGLPLFVQPTDIALATDADRFRTWFREHEADLDALLYTAGALVFRGFAVRDTHDFSALVDHYGTPSFGYTGGSTPRSQLAPKVFEATKTPANMHLALHQEMAYLPNYPARISFYCRMPSVTDGETILGDMRRVTAALDPAFVAEVDRRGVLYTRNMRDKRRSSGNPFLDAIHRNWQDAFSTEDPDEAVAQARSVGLDTAWLDDDSLSVIYRGPGFINHPRTGERLWFNQIQTLNLGPHNTANFELYEQQYGATGRYPFAAAYGDGEPVSAQDAQALAQTLHDCSVAFPWSSGDVLLIDNYRTAHGRNPFTGERDVQVALLN